MTKEVPGASLTLRLLTFALVMFVLLGAVGFGVGLLELVLWLTTLIAGTCLIVRRSRKSRVSKPSLV